jgi:hypothetical protein
LYFHKIFVNITFWSIREAGVINLLKGGITIIIVIIFVKNFTYLLMAMSISRLTFLVSNNRYTMNTWNTTHIISNNSFSNRPFVLLVNEINHIIFILTHLMAQLMILSVQIAFKLLIRIVKFWIMKIHWIQNLKTSIEITIYIVNWHLIEIAYLLKILIQSRTILIKVNIHDFRLAL